MKSTSEANQPQYHGTEKVWTTIRRDNRYYVTNKVFSFFLAASLAAYTLSFKGMVQKHAKENNQYDYTVAYWVLFIFYSFQALDELIELYSVLDGREKGALGLLFEMNYFLAVGLLSFILWMIYYKSPPSAEYMPIYNFLYYQVCVVFAGLGLCIFVLAFFMAINSRISRSGSKGTKVSDL